MAGPLFVDDDVVVEHGSRFFSDDPEYDPDVETYGTATTQVKLRIDRDTPLSSGFGPGAAKWGRLQGCNFVRGSARRWGERYTCTTRRTRGCTADNRMAAVCVVRDWEGGYVYHQNTMAHSN